MAYTTDYHYEVEIKGATEFKSASPTSLNPDFRPSLYVYINSYVYRYDWDNDHNSAPDVFCLDDYQPARIGYSRFCFGCCDFRDSSAWTDLYSNAMSSVNPNITRGSEVHDEILNGILRIIDDVYSALNVDVDRCTILTSLRLDVTVSEHVMDQCMCEVCRAIEESALMEEQKVLVPASEASIKNLKRVRVVAASDDLEQKKHANGGRKRRKTTSEKEDERPSDEDECSICCEHFTAGKYVAQMPCSHLFHEPCIAEWLRRSGRCPLCRKDLPAAPRGRTSAKIVSKPASIGNPSIT